MAEEDPNEPNAGADPGGGDGTDWEAKYREAAECQWRYIRDVLTDRRPGSEWFWFVSEDGAPGELPIVEPWKCPYHNGRMMMEIIRRNPDVEV